MGIDIPLAMALVSVNYIILLITFPWASAVLCVWWELGKAANTQIRWRRKQHKAINSSILGFPFGAHDSSVKTWLCSSAAYPLFKGNFIQSMETQAVGCYCRKCFLRIWRQKPHYFSIIEGEWGYNVQGQSHIQNNQYRLVLGSYFTLINKTSLCMCPV